LHDMRRQNMYALAALSHLRNAHKGLYR